MDSGASELRPIRFGSFEANLAAGELRKNGVRLKLQGQPLEVLAALLERPGEVVTREELKQRLWSSDTFVDFDRGLNTAVNKIRETLGDSASTPRFVQTLPRRGYRFMAPVDGAPAVPAAAPESKLGWWRIGAVVAAIMMVALPLWVASRNGAPDSNSLTATPLTSYAGVELQPSFSPDGSQVVFAGGEDPRNCDIYVKQIGVDQPTPLTTHPDHEFSPAWSPTGTHIAFLRVLSSSRVQLILIPQRGGPERVLAEFPGDWQLARPATYDHLLAWDPEGNWIVTPAYEEGHPVGLFAIHVNSGQRHQLTWPKRTQRDTSPAWSPDGRSLAFSRYNSSHRSDLYLLRLSGDMEPVNDLVRLPPADMENHYPTWTADGKEIVFAAGSFWNDSLWITEPSEQAKPQRLGFTAGWQPAISRSEDRLVFAQVGLDYNIWAADLPGAGEQSSAPVPFLDSTYADLSPDYSPDGKRVAFVSMRTGWLEIWLCDADGSRLEQLTSFGGPYLQWPRWSPRGNEIVFYAEEEGNAEIYKIDLARRAPVRLTDHPGWDADPRWSNDGKWIYFISDRGGPRGVWKIPASGGQAVPLKGRLANLAIEGVPGPPIESADDKHLYFLHGHPRVNSIWRVPVGGGEEVPIFGQLGTFPSLEVTEDGLYFVGKAGENGVEPIQFLDFASGGVRTVARPTVKTPFSLSVSPDRRTLLYCQRDGAGSDLMFVEGFR